jgi:inosine-uridine nucleoside N-ribohydrolase
LPTALIIDTDMSGGGCRDVDDTLAVCLANALADSGEAELLAVVHDTLPAQTAGVTSALLGYYGRDADVPIGAYKGTAETDRTALPYVAEVVRTFSPRIVNTSQVPDAVEVYRAALASQPDASVAIASIGLLVNLARLLRSTPDRHSSLDGTDLVAAKVSRLVVMGGAYPGIQGGTDCECNFCAMYNGGGDHAAAAAATAFVVAGWPRSVPVIYSGLEVGLQVQTGGGLSRCAPASNPCRVALTSFMGGPGKGRYSWDPITTLVAVRGVEAAPGLRRCHGCDGANRVDPVTGANWWERGPPSNQTYLVLEDAKAVAQTIDELICRAPHRLGTGAVARVAGPPAEMKRSFNRALYRH